MDLAKYLSVILKVVIKTLAVIYYISLGYFSKIKTKTQPEHAVNCL